MPVQGHPVVIAENGKGIPVNPVTGRAPLLTVAANGKGVPIVISTLGAPFIVQGYDPGPEPDQLAFLATDDGEPLADDSGEYVETYSEA